MFIGIMEMKLEAFSICSSKIRCLKILLGSHFSVSWLCPSLIHCLNFIFSNFGFSNLINIFSIY